MAIQEVIKYEGDNSTLIYKHPAEAFNTLSQLIVHESQEAVFFSDGQALDSFKAGRYTLETKNIPLISKIRNLVSGGVSPFHVEVYFINLATMMDIAWGTPSQQVINILQRFRHRNRVPSKCLKDLFSSLKFAECRLQMRSTAKKLTKCWKRCDTVIRSVHRQWQQKMRQSDS